MTATPPSPPPGTHTEHEDDPWTVLIPDHPGREDTPEYVASRSRMNQLADTVANLEYGKGPYQCHHGGGLWLKDAGGWFLVRNVAGIEWSAQFCADPAKVDQLRLNARRLYAAFPDAARELGIQELLDTPITDAAGISRWTDGLCNASVPLPPPLHTGTLPAGGGVHHYPTPVTDIQLVKHDDFVLWVTDGEGQPAAVVPMGPRGSGDGRVQLVYATPGTRLARTERWGEQHHEPHVLPNDHPLALQAFRHQSGAPAEPQG